MGKADNLKLHDCYRVCSEAQQVLIYQKSACRPHTGPPKS